MVGYTGNMTRETVTPAFSPTDGLRVHPTVKETLLSLLAEGYFDNAKTLALGVASADAFDLTFIGTCWDRAALLSYMDKRNYELWNQ